ncbi:MAG TPA: hypothetical protein VMH26_21675 [Burkholderiales bacterium]|nr:hypothetical protein [Burkholderiales bacterium]
MARTLQEQREAGKRLGKRPRKVDARTLRLASYLDFTKLPALPASQDWYSKVAAFGMDGNDSVGDCVIAGCNHGILQQSTYASTPKSATEQQCLDQYFALTGGADTGLVIGDTLKYWKNTGLFPFKDKNTAYASVDPTKLDEVKYTILLYGYCMAGISLPDVDTFGPWLQVQGPPDLANGHDIILVGWDDAKQVLYVVTWGEVVQMSYAFFNAYVAAAAAQGEAWIILDIDWINAQGQSPGGVDLPTLQTDIAVVTSGPPVTPVPTLTLTASAMNVAAGDQVTLTWASANATDVVGAQTLAGDYPLSGTLAVTVEATTTYALTASGPGGSVTEAVVVTVGPQPNPNPPKPTNWGLVIGIAVAVIAVAIVVYFAVKGG